MRKSILVLIIIMTGLMFYAGCDDDDSGGQGAPAPTPTPSPPPGGGVPPGGGIGPLPAPVPQTGQTTCWDSDGDVIMDCTGTGHDGDIQAGVMPPDPRFTDNGDGTITDNLTGLIWLQDANCPGRGRTWDQAFADVEELNASQMMNGNNCDNYTASFMDWRLPNVRELASLLDYENSALPTDHPFLNVPPATYWSSNTSKPFPGRAWQVSFGDGLVNHSDKKESDFFFVVIAVRGPELPAVALSAPVPQTGQTTCWDSDGDVIMDCTGTGHDGDIQAGVMPPDPRFTDNGDGTITDNLTGLIWLQDANCAALGPELWATALSNVNNLADPACGLSDGSKAGDWQLPNVRELASLLDYENSALPTDHPFLNAQEGLYWSSTTSVGAGILAFAWVVDFGGSGGGEVFSDRKSRSFLHVTAVRNPF